MTIAAVYVSAEGVVLGADSTTTFFNSNGAHYLDHAQKLFEIGDGSSLGVITWGLGGLMVSSYRQLFAVFADTLAATPPTDVAEVSARWIQFFHHEYTTSAVVVEYQRLAALAPHNPATPGLAGTRSEEEEATHKSWTQGLVVGFCIAGCIRKDRQPEAAQILFEPTGAVPTAVAITAGFSFWGAPNIVRRLIWGADPELQDAIASSPNWTGTPADLQSLVDQCYLSPSFLPMREAVDFVHFGIFSTIKAFKFSNFSQICGGPIEIAVITADRPFRWVRHKAWDSALVEGDV